LKLVKRFWEFRNEDGWSTSENGERRHQGIRWEDAVVQYFTVILQHTAMPDDAILAYMYIATYLLGADNGITIYIDVAPNLHLQILQLFRAYFFSISRPDDHIILDDDILTHI